MVTGQPEYHPSLLWSQDERKIFINVKLTEVKDPRMQIGNASIHFNATGMGANGLQEYGFSLDLFEPIDDETSDFTVTETGVNIVLVKREAGVWPRLTQAANQRPPWLRTDFDRLSSAVVKAMLVAGGDADESDSSEEDSQPRTNVKCIRPSAEEIRKRNVERAEEIARQQYDEFFNYIKNPLVIYLLLFNIFQWAGFIYIFGVIVRGWWTEGDAMKKRVFDMVADRLMVLQLASFLEIAHVLLGWVKGGVLPTIGQVFGRNLVLFAILLPHKELQEDTVVFNLFLAWSMIELVRYPYYALRLFDEEIGLVTYLRYTLWIPLYPIGFMSEGKLIILAMPLLEESRRFCIEMPNPANISFDFPTFLHIYILLMLPGFFNQMRYMYFQRRKKLTLRFGGRAGGR
ncbi:Very-long-chain (3R)-3-hydroxyacyl-CoA dehydratase [Echinococcus granulosus]|uniref:Very-long-chain (3R)-3-hydroxyacyl-CoA dehydratase n=1 Tax=Echinococcus granulosus TaxID=6210 RepID=A0A068WJP5_ECHGR|nr:Very-long-chain (3R)-3-hydroxyacyl-CoA dehydratase [Echinococcus granulosus]CDS17914.1 3 hydroxyacyl coenzyme A dehydratase 3 [Echinococcus granulosus]